MKTVLINGATDGIGFETARQLLAAGMHVMLHGHREAKAARQAKALAAGVTDRAYVLSVGRIAHEVGEGEWEQLLADEQLVHAYLGAQAHLRGP